MKKLLLPVAIAVFAGLGGGSGFSYVRAKKSAALEVLHADSVKAVAKKLLAFAKDSAAKAALIAPLDSVPLTPADSIRMAQQKPFSLQQATHGVPNAVDPKAKPATATATSAEASSAKVDVKPGTKDATGKATVPVAGAAVTGTPPVVSALIAPKIAVPVVTDPARARADSSEAMLSEKRLPKIFGAMQSKDAARVMEQMSDSDVRMILGLMGDKQAAAILSAFSPQRAATISKGAKKPIGNTP